MSARQRPPDVPATERRRLADLLRQETTGGALVMAAAVLAIILANSPLATVYTGIRDAVVGPAALHLDLTIATWTADGLLALFFFLVGLELKHELVAGALRDPRQAVVPVAAALGGVLVPAGLYVLVNAGASAALRGWPIPTATDIAFALAVLAVVGRGLPVAARLFLLTLAIVDDLVAIVLIAVLYAESVDVALLAAATIPVLGFAVTVRRGSGPSVPPLLVVTAVATWLLVHASGIHATIAGVLLAAVVPVRAGASGALTTDRLEHALRPLSAGVAVPLFALFAAGVPVGGVDGLGRAVADPVAIGIIAGLVVGKPLGIVLTTSLVTRLTGARLDPELEWIDVLAVGAVAGIGFTVSLLVADLSFGTGSDQDAHAKLAVLLASVLAGILAALIAATRRRRAGTAGSG